MGEPFYATRKLLLDATLPDGVVARVLEEAEPLSPGMTTAYILLCIVLVIFSGIMAGLTLGLLSLDRVDLQVIKRSGTERERWLVSRIEPVLAKPHYLLATLLLCNSGAMETLPIFLDRLLNPVAAIIISVTAILVFGEILPQAVCKRYGLQIGAYFSYLVRFLMLFTGLITWPIGKLLDWMLGEDSALFRRAELKALVNIHAEPEEDGALSVLTHDEVQVIQGALDMATKTADTAMTPMSKVFAVSIDAVIDEEMLRRVIERGHSRVPVYEGNNKANIVGVVLVKELVLAEMDGHKRIKDMRIREVPCLRSDIPLYDVLKIFRTGKSHMACLTKVSGKLEEILASEGSLTLKGGSIGMVSGPGGDTTASGVGPSPGLWLTLRKPSAYVTDLASCPDIIGIITIEDVLEELLQQEIVDETDLYVDNLQTVRPNMLVSLQHLPPSLRRFLSRSLAATASPLSASAGTPNLQRSPNSRAQASRAPSATATANGAAGEGASPGVTDAQRAAAAAADSNAQLALAAVAGVIGAVGSGPPLQQTVGRQHMLPRARPPTSGSRAASRERRATAAADSDAESIVGEHVGLTSGHLQED
ncbi:hypothetical protein ACKKBG_A19145 [Auxenochlorella protothecoides x Auxenochlorella symbiontica]